MRVRFGDIVEIETSVGLAYAIYTHRHTQPPRYGALLRIFDKLFSARPVPLESVAAIPIRFSVFFPLQAAVNKNLVKIAGNVLLPENLEPFPLFRAGSRNAITKKVNTWWLWNGERKWRVGTLTDDQRTLPILRIWNDTMLVRRIESGWRPENDLS